MTSELIGYIEPNVNVRPIKINGTDEIFHILRCTFRGIDMDVVISSYVYTGVTGTVKITGSYATQKSADETGKIVHVPFIFAQSLESVPDDTPLTNKVRFELRVTKRYKFLVTDQGMEVLFLYGTVINAFNKIEVYKICLKRAYARKYSNCKKGTTITATAYIKSYGRGIEFSVDEVIE